jgi:hypothetical protein
MQALSQLSYSPTRGRDIKVWLEACQLPTEIMKRVMPVVVRPIPDRGGRQQRRSPSRPTRASGGVASCAGAERRLHGRPGVGSSACTLACPLLRTPDPPTHSGESEPKWRHAQVVDPTNAARTRRLPGEGHRDLRRSTGPNELFRGCDPVEDLGPSEDCQRLIDRRRDPAPGDRDPQRLRDLA